MLHNSKHNYYNRTNPRDAYLNILIFKDFCLGLYML